MFSSCTPHQDDGIGFTEKDETEHACIATRLALPNRILSRRENMSHSLQTTYQQLLAAYGPQFWWPGDGPFEIMIGAVLTQNTSWKNVELALENLREASVLDPDIIHDMPVEELAEMIRPAGYYRQKAKRLKNLTRLLCDEFNGSIERLFELSTQDLRERLLAVNGVGPETADSIALYAAEKPIFVVDAYTNRVLKRHGWIDFEADYHEIQQHFHNSLEHNTGMFNEFHALMVQVGKNHCGKQAKCDGCPLQNLLPAGGPLEPFA